MVIVADTDMSFDSISFDNHGAAYALGGHLARSGHRHAAILAGVQGHATMSARTAGFVEGLRSGGVDPRHIRIVYCEVSRQGGFAGAQRLLAEGLGDTHAVLAVNDIVAIGAMSALRAGGVRVPSEVSLTGFDDIQLAVDVTPRLTTVALPLAHVGTEAIRLATGNHAERTHLTVHGHVVVRDSTMAR
jgi:LacI family transcriptional regulator